MTSDVYKNHLNFDDLRKSTSFPRHINAALCNAMRVEMSAVPGF